MEKPDEVWEFLLDIEEGRLQHKYGGEVIKHIYALELCIEKLEQKIQKYKYILARLQSEVLTQYPEQSILEDMMQEIEND